MCVCVCGGWERGTAVELKRVRTVEYLIPCHHIKKKQKKKCAQHYLIIL